MDNDCPINHWDYLAACVAFNVTTSPCLFIHYILVSDEDGKMKWRRQ